MPAYEAEVPAPTRILLADDDPLVRRALRAVLENDGMCVVAEAETGRQAVDLALEHRPELVVMDVVMPELDGVEATRELYAKAPAIPVVVLTSCDDYEVGILALRHGAAGYLAKDLDVERLPRALRAVLNGEAAVSRRLTLRLVERLRQIHPDTSGVRPVRSALTGREWEVLDLLCAGAGTEEVSDQLVISTETVRSHVKAILRKLGVSSRREAVEAAGRLRAAGSAHTPG